MKLTTKQLRSIISEEVIKLDEEVKFEDVSMMAHDAKLYEAVGELHRALMAKLKDSPEAEKWLRELVQDAVDSQVEDYDMDKENMGDEESKGRWTIHDPDRKDLGS